MKHDCITQLMFRSGHTCSDSNTWIPLNPGLSHKTWKLATMATYLAQCLPIVKLAQCRNPHWVPTLGAHIGRPPWAPIAWVTFTRLMSTLDRTHIGSYGESTRDITRRTLTCARTKTTSEMHQDMLRLKSENSFHLILDQCGALQPLKQIRHFAVQSGMLCTTVKPADVSRPHFVVLAWISSLLTYTEAGRL